MADRQNVGGVGDWSIVPNERFCFNCINQVEDEYHVLMSCNLYEDIREKLFTKIFEINPDFPEYSDDNKFCYILSNDEIVKYSAKACHDILVTRQNTLYR